MVLLLVLLPEAKELLDLYVHDTGYTVLRDHKGDTDELKIKIRLWLSWLDYLSLATSVHKYIGIF